MMTSPPKTLLVAIALLVLLFSKLSLAAFVSIDCGSSESSTDTQTNITWTGDDAYTQLGESHRITSTSGVLSSLRAFPDGKNNCYSIEVQQGEKVLTRATFFYGNYDNKSSPPVFDLLFDGNYWAAVNTSSLYYVDYEAIYVTKGNTTDICVAQTNPNEIPFISSLELRSLNFAMYSQVDPTNNALILQGRYAFGADQIIRYPDDVFDRIWSTSSGSDQFISYIKSEASVIDITTFADHPPQAAMQNAITTTTASYSIEYKIFPTAELTLYINSYFSEVIKAAAGLRSIQILIDNTPILSNIVPPFGSVGEVYIKTTVSSETAITFLGTSTLPAILNAIEVYKIVPLPEGTDTRDGT